MKLSDLNIFQRLSKLEDREAQLQKDRSELILTMARYLESRIDSVDKRITDTGEDMIQLKSILSKPPVDLDIKPDLDVM